jgi:uroporphyrinogen decarboxylase
VFGGHIGPFSLAGRLFDLTEILMAVRLEPDIIHILLDKCTCFLIEYAKTFKKKGANGIFIAEPPEFGFSFFNPALFSRGTGRYQ